MPRYSIQRLGADRKQLLLAMDGASKARDYSAMDEIGTEIENLDRQTAQETEHRKLDYDLQNEMSFSGGGLSGGVEGLKVGAGKRFTDLGLGALDVGYDLFSGIDRALGTETEFDKGVTARHEDDVQERRDLDRAITDAPGLSPLSLGGYLPDLAMAAINPASSARTLGGRMLGIGAKDVGTSMGIAALDETIGDESRAKNMAISGALTAPLSVGGTWLQTGLGKYIPKATDDMLKTHPDLHDKLAHITELDTFLKSKGVNLTVPELMGEKSTLSNVLSFVAGSGEDTARKKNLARAVSALEELRDGYTDQRTVSGALQSALDDATGRKEANDIVKESLYNKSSDALSRAGPVTPTNTVSKVREILDKSYPEEVRSVLSNPQMNKLLGIDDTLSAAPSTQAQQLIDRFGNPLRAASEAPEAAPLKDIPATAMDELRKMVGDNTTAVKGSIRGNAKQLYKAVASDMAPPLPASSPWADANPEAASALRDANTYFAEKYQPLYGKRTSILANALKEQDPDVLAKLLAPNRGRRVLEQLPGFNKKGRESLRGALLQRTLDKVDDTSNSKTIARTLDLGSTIDSLFFFDKKQGKQVKQLAESLRKMDPHNSDTILKRLVSKNMLGNAGAAAGASALHALPGYAGGVGLSRYVQSIRRKGTGRGTELLVEALKAAERNKYPKDKDEENN